MRCAATKLVEGTAFAAENLASQLRADARLYPSHPEVARRLTEAATALWAVGARCRGTLRSPASDAAEELRRALEALLEVRS